MNWRTMLTKTEKQQITASMEAMFSFADHVYISFDIAKRITKIFIDIEVEQAELANKLAKVLGQEFKWSPSAFVGDTQVATRYSASIWIES